MFMRVCVGMRMFGEHGMMRKKPCETVKNNKCMYYMWFTLGSDEQFAPLCWLIRDLGVGRCWLVYATAQTDCQSSARYLFSCVGGLGGWQDPPNRTPKCCLISFPTMVSPHSYLWVMRTGIFNASSHCISNGILSNASHRPSTDHFCQQRWHILFGRILIQKHRFMCIDPFLKAGPLFDCQFLPYFSSQFSPENSLLL